MTQRFLAIGLLAFYTGIITSAVGQEMCTEGVYTLTQWMAFKIILIMGAVAVVRFFAGTEYENR